MKKALAAAGVGGALAAVAAGAFAVTQGGLSTGASGQTEATAAAEPAVLAEGQLTSGRLREASGLARSLRTPGLYWSHNDSGGAPELFALSADGTDRGVTRVRGATADDWEDIASGPCPAPGTGPCLYIGDIGDNRSRRPFITVIVVPEPEPGAAEVEALVRARFTYPGGPRNAEALVVHPVTGVVSIVEKRGFAPEGIGVFSAAPPFANRLGELTLAGRIPPRTTTDETIGTITAADFTPDGQRLVLRDYQRGHVLDAPAGTGPEALFAATPVSFPLPRMGIAEALAVVPEDGAVVVTAEGLRAPIATVALPPRPQF